ncbi:processive 1,2-diacylglycerol beta-glucosyltransferase [Paenibacillus taihuensis]|uniref:Processive 1,2-diacylglycerol beta-glucosyltransferase n=1 Tax=Paenibacillus taihuensis TaxID=1156355 RepID=A0A3D9S7B5_9BACL|nr:glycosyltransferase [Paenibacillus taihuensis]REE89056.1 processive 1,2-diacylglycerol beta-glucosyltransferase [Paenibacillus taihuensis]
MNPKRKVLIVYAMYGDGHYQVARTMQRRLERTGLFNVKLIDMFAQTNPVWNAVSRYIFHKGSIYFPDIYGWLYTVTNQLKPNSPINRWLQLLGLSKMKAIAAEERPDAVIHTFPLLAMSKLKEQDGNSFACFTIVTDYVAHCRWIHPDTDRYFVASDELKTQLTSAGVHPHRIVVSGIPIRSAFHESIPIADVKQKYGLQVSKPIVLIMAGAYGVINDAAAMVEEIERMEEAQVLLVCGRNRSLYQAMSGAFGTAGHVRVFGYVERIEELMAMSSCLITKAGGITLAEARKMRLPVVVYRPLPGQERGNAEYWQSKGFVQIVNDKASLVSAVQRAIERKPEIELEQEQAVGDAAAGADRLASDTVLYEIAGLVHKRSKKNSDVDVVIQGRQLIDEYT